MASDQTETTIPRPGLDEDEIMTACDYPGEAAEAIAKSRGCSFAEALLLVEGWMKVTMSDPQTTKLADLIAVMDRASASVALWPQREREAYREAFKTPVDPCRCHRRCDDAQTCAGGCVYE